VEPILNIVARVGSLTHPSLTFSECSLVGTRRIHRLVVPSGAAWATRERRGDAPDFVEVGEAGIAVGDAMRRERRVQLVG
jgi:hypothetical protein